MSASNPPVIPIEGGKFARPRTVSYAERRRLALRQLGFAPRGQSAGPKLQLESRGFRGEGRFLATMGESGGA